MLPPRNSKQQQAPRFFNTSVIIPVHNAEATIRATLESVFASSLRACEVIVVDDASTDGALSICKAFSVKVVSLKENRGPAIGRNVGVSQSEGGVLIFLDSDVTFAPDLLQRMLNRLAKNPELSGVGTLSSSIPLNPCFFSRYFALQEYVMMDGLFGDKGEATVPYICTRCGCIRRCAFDQIGKFNEAYQKPSIEDYEFSLRMEGKYGVLYDRTLVNRHHFPDTAWKIFRRYHRNTREMIQLICRTGIKTPAPFENDAAGRLCVGFSWGFFFAGFIDPIYFPASAAAFLMAAVMRRRLLHRFYTDQGWVFMLKGWLLYTVSTIPVATGLVSGFLSLIWRRIGAGFQGRIDRKS